MKYLTQLIFSVYNTLSGGKIEQNYRVIKARHQREEEIKAEDVEAYLRSHQIKGSLAQQPLMTKRDISQKIGAINPNDIHTYAYTGGSYGEPFKIPYSKNRALIRTASFKYFNEAAGYQLGDAFMLIAAKQKPKWWQFLRNEHRFVPTNLTTNKVAEAVKHLVDQQLTVVIGFPSVIFELASFIKQNQIKHAIKTVIFTSEPIEEIKRQFIKDALKCEVIDRYSNEEVGLIAQQKTFGSAYFTNRFNVLVELLDEQLQPVKEGEVGRVVVTDLAADLVPIVRYDTGDLAVAQEYRNGQLYALSSISGRVAEQLLATDGAPVAGLALGPLIHMPLSTAGYFPQYQFAQVAPTRYQLRIRKNNEQLPSTVLEQITRNLKGILGDNATIEHLLVDDIKPQPSGKRPIYKNEM
jgi:phenylacetate-CoA ligase